MSFIRIRRVLGTWLIAAVLSTPVVAEERAGHDDIAAAIASGKAALSLRYRYESVDQDAFSRRADASTLRLRLNYGTDSWRGWVGFMEFDYVMEAVLDDFNDGAGNDGANRSDYPVVADPSGADLNQLYLQYAPLEQWRARIGRQRILLDDQRFVGGVGWRQNEQTYDALSVQYAGMGKTKLFYAYVANVNRIFGSRVAAGDHEQNTHLLNVRVGLGKDWSAVAYAYLIDNEDFAAFSTHTFGLRMEGGLELGEGRLALLGEVARQSDAGDATADFDASYFRLQGLWSLNTLSAGLGFESLGSDNAQGFRTPLATLHAFNGWADQFLATPAGGLEDMYVRLGLAPGSWNFQLVFHDFSAESGGGDYGSELDVSAARDFGARYKLLLKLARFDADSPGYTDTTKAWVMLAATF